MIRNHYRPLLVVSLFAVAACSGGTGTMNSSVPASQPVAPQSAQATTQTQTRTTLSKSKDERDNEKDHRKATKDVDFGYALFGDATLVHPGHNSHTAVQASYSAAYPALGAYGGVDFAFPAGATYSQLQNLSSDYQFTVGSCGDGAPRFAVTLTKTIGSVTTTGEVWFYFGPSPNYTLCPPNVWSNTGNLASAPNTVDDSQLPGGGPYDPYAVSQTKFGSYTITDVNVVVDGFSAFRTVQWDNVGVTIGTDNEIYTFENGGPDKGFTDGKDDKSKGNDKGHD
jgi:hypothetical protein